ncbi:hypothetical protein [Oceaniglobus roseus]|uniref:hypothetical protein n=1 Tax=Oceaniglobus roseus TaxID=1737570 RepID=UPI000C7ECABC|nr:hypothetical protein [Kandeliimicrobium roseum]
MRTSAIALLATTLLAAPAFAQSTSTGQDSTSTGNTTATQGTTANSNDMAASGSGGCDQMLGQSASASGSGAKPITSAADLESQLSEAGFTDVKVRDSNYLIQATAPSNECVLLVVDASGNLMQGTEPSGATGSGSAATTGTAADSTADASGSTAGTTTGSASSGASATTGGSTDMASNGTSSSTASTDSSAGDMVGDQKMSAMDSQKNFESELSKAGYSDINVLDSSFVAEAKLENGATVTMLVRSDSKLK